MRAVSAILGQHWAMTPEALQQMIAIAGRFEGRNSESELQAIEKELGRPLSGAEQTRERDGIAIIPIKGSLFRYGNLFTRISGGTSYETTARDLHAALTNPQIKGILLNVDSPGGEVNGAHELAEMIYAAREIKPVEAYVSYQSCSGGYWLASSASRITADVTAILGCLGVIWATYDYSKAEEKAGVREIVIVSDQSPHKHTDPATEDGYARMQELATKLAAVFIARVARNRGVSEEKVMADFGQGWVKVGQDAIDAGLADELGSFESAFVALKERIRPRPRAGLINPANRNRQMEIDKQEPAETITAEPNAAAAPAQPTAVTRDMLIAQHPQLVAEFRAEGATAERKRIADIEALALPGHEKLLASAKADGSITAEIFATQQIKAEQQAGNNALAAIKGDEQDLTAPNAVASPANDTPSQPSGNGIGAANPARVQRILTAGKRPAKK